MNLDKLKSDNFFKNILKVFPRWADIRKRPKSSDGGLFLLSIAQEFDQIANELNEYRKDFFIFYYIGREDKIIDYLYAGEVGESDSLELNESAVTLTTDVKEFYLNTGLCLYQEGYLFVKQSDNDILNGMLHYKVDDAEYAINLKKEHIWNAIDEFALFSGLKRYDNELNKSLLRRVLANYINKPNSTDEGLKNAIINAIEQDEAVSADEIIIEKIDESNAFLKDEYIGAGSIYDYVSYLNQDVYKTKRWDISDWEHSFKTMSFIPSKWDQEITVMQNGVGDSKSLEVLTGEEIDETIGENNTDVAVSLYEESSYKINEYIRNNDIKKNIQLGLTQFKNSLNPITVNYKILASNVMDIKKDIENIMIVGQKKVTGSVDYFIQDLIMDSTDVNQLVESKQNILKANTDYEIDFTAKNPYGDMIINKCDLDRVSILKENREFKLDKDGKLYNNNVKLNIESVDDVTSSSGIIDVEGKGMVLEDAATPGIINLDIDGMGGNYFYIDKKCEEVSIITNDKYISTKNMEFSSDNKWKSTNSKDGNSLTIQCKCSSLSYSVVGNCSITTYENNILKETNIYADPIDMALSYNTQTDVKIVITRLGIEQLCVNKISMSSYNIEVKLASGDLITTSMGTILPTVDKNSVTVTVTAMTAFSPVIKCIHIGANLKNSIYKLKFTTGANPQVLDIDSTCIVTLIEDPTGAKTVYNNYDTKKSYTNNTGSEITIKISTDYFYSILDSSITMYNIVYNGKTVKYIIVKPGETIKKITISGTLFKTISSKYLDSILSSISGIKYSDMVNVYISKNLKGFIIKTNSSETLIKITKQNINSVANIIKINGMPNTMTGVFIVDDNGTEVINSYTEVNFEYLSMQPIENTECIAYNKYSTVKTINNGIAIVDQFYPSTPTNMLMLYKIDNISCNSGASCNVYFEKDGVSKDIWSIGKKNIDIEITADNGSNCETINNMINIEFQLTNTIDLDKVYTIGSNSYELARYTISPIEGMTIEYSTEENSEDIAIDENGFNKLYFSNISGVISLNDKTGKINIDSSKYSILKAEGIIAWDPQFAKENKDLAVSIDYKYDCPIAITFKSISDIYKIVGYAVDAYKLMDGYPIIYNGIQDGESIKIDTSKRIIAICKNPNFGCLIDKDSMAIKVFKNSSSDTAVVRAGTFYHNGLEYYHFADKEITKFDKMSHVTTHNVDIEEDCIDFYMRSGNFLPDSSMRTKRLGEVCIIDFVKNDRINGISSMNSLTACDTFNGWYIFDMDISIVEALNGYGVKFTSYSNSGFACIDITRFISENKTVSLYSKDGLNVYIGRNVSYNSMQYTRSIAIEKYTDMILGKNSRNDDIAWYTFSKADISTGSNYYIVVQGNGTLDDIIIKEDINVDPTDGHIKNIDALGFTVQEVKPTGFIEKFTIDDFGSDMNRIEFTSDGLLRTGATMDWGLTKLFDITDSNWSSCTYTAKKQRTMLLSTDDTNFVITPAIYIRNFKSIKTLQVKINELIKDSMKGFNIQVLTCSTSDGNFISASTIKSGNTVSVPKARLLEYVKIKVTMPNNKVINNIEVFAEYIENKVDVLKSVPYKYGTMISKIYDIGDPTNLRAKSINVESSNEIDKIFISIRGCRTDKSNMVWTEWKQIEFDPSTIKIMNTVEFENYSLYQFKIDIYDENANIKIDSIEFEVF